MQGEKALLTQESSQQWDMIYCDEGGDLTACYGVCWLESCADSRIKPGTVGHDLQLMRVVTSEPVVVRAGERALLTPESYPRAVGRDVQLTRVVMSEPVVVHAGERALLTPESMQEQWDVMYSWWRWWHQNLLLCVLVKEHYWLQNLCRSSGMWCTLDEGGDVRTCCCVCRVRAAGWRPWKTWHSTPTWVMPGPP